MKKIVMTLTFMISIAMFSTQAAAATYHTVQSGDTLWKISNRYGVSITSLKKLNNEYDAILYPGQRLQIPSSISSADKELMARLVRAEAEGEPYAGKVAVATVILNRVDSHLFPNTVREVIYQRSSGYYAFSPVQNGQINKPADAESRRAVNEALAFRGQGSGSLYFYNPKTAKSTWILSKHVTVTIGNHRFAK